MCYLATHSTHFIYGYMVSDICLRTTLIARKETRCRHIGYSFRLAARILLYASSHRQDNTYHILCYKPVVEHWLEREIAQWVHPMMDRSDDPSHHERMLLPRSYISLPTSLGHDIYKHLIFPSSLRKHLHADIDKPVQVWVTTLVQVSTTYMQILTSLSRSGWLHSYRSRQLTCRYWQACPGLGDYTCTGLDNLHADIDKPVQVWVTTLVEVSTTCMAVAHQLT